LLVGGFFAFNYFNSNDSANIPPNTPERQVSGDPPRTTEQSESKPTEVPLENSGTPPDNVQEQPNQTLSVRGEQKTGETPAKAKKTPIPSQPTEKKASQTAAKTPVPKKKDLTVDDLINDN
jgi:hypothetical protein